MSDRITFSDPYCSLNVERDVILFKFRTFSQGALSQVVSTHLTSVSVPVPHLTARDHLHIKPQFSILIL